MAYIGVQPKAGQYRKLDDISSGFNGATTTFTTSVDGDNVTAPAPQQLLVSIGGVIQQPNVDYVTNTNSITFTTAPTAGLSFFAILMGDAVNIGTPSDGSVTTAKLVNDSVTTAKLDSAGIAPIVTSLNGGPLSGARNRIINGDMRIDQRNAGASVGTGSGLGVYTVDRWAVSYAQTNKLTAQQSSVAPTGFKNSLLITSSSSYSVLAGDYFFLRQHVEGFNTADFGWGAAGAQTVTLSFWVRSSLTGTFGGSFRNNSTNRSYPFTYTISAANTWEQKTVTVAGDTSGTWTTDNTSGIEIDFALGVGSTFSGTAGSWSGSNFVSATGATSVVGTNGATFYITGVQLEAGTVATPFERRSYGQELALCQRYYEQGDYYIRAGVSNASIVTSYYTSCYFMVEKRIVPTVTGTNDQGTFAVQNIRTNTAGVGRSDTVANVNNSGTFIAAAEL